MSAMTATRTRAIPFEAAKKFKMNGVDVAPGDVVDVSCMSLLRIEQMENTGYGLRVGSDERVTTAAPRRPLKQAARRGRASQPRKRAGAKAEE